MFSSGTEYYDFFLEVSWLLSTLTPLENIAKGLILKNIYPVKYKNDPFRIQIHSDFSAWVRLIIQPYARSVSNLPQNPMLTEWHAWR